MTCGDLNRADFRRHGTGAAGSGDPASGAKTSARGALMPVMRKSKPPKLLPRMIS
jgi:hypothetical protein